MVFYIVYSNNRTNICLKCYNLILGLTLLHVSAFSVHIQGSFVKDKSLA